MTPRPQLIHKAWEKYSGRYAANEVPAELVHLQKLAFLNGAMCICREMAQVVDDMESGRRSRRAPARVLVMLLRDLQDELLEWVKKLSGERPAGIHANEQSE